MAKDMSNIKALLSLAVFAVTLGGAIWFTEFGTIQGVPVSVILQFLRDDTARNAYFSGDKQQLHDRLDLIGIEEKVKAFYRPQIQDEVELDKYIHQLFYNSTGYVGKAYDVNAQGILVSKKVQDPVFEQWFKLASQAGIVTGRREVAGVQYVIGSAGTVVRYDQAAALFPLNTLQTMIDRK